MNQTDQCSIKLLLAEKYYSSERIGTRYKSIGLAAETFLIR